MGRGIIYKQILSKFQFLKSYTCKPLMSNVMRFSLAIEKFPFNSSNENLKCLVENLSNS